MGRPKGSKNKKTLEKTNTESTNNETLELVKVSYNSYVKELPVLSKPETPLGDNLVTSQVHEKELDLPNLTSHIDSFESLKGDTLERVSNTDSKANKQGKYYQFMHPCNIENPPFHYRFISVIKNGNSYSSLPFENREECHKVLKQLIETDVLPTHLNMYQN